MIKVPIQINLKLMNNIIDFEINDNIKKQTQRNVDIEIDFHIKEHSTK